MGDLAYLVDLDMANFGALIEAATRIHYLEKTEGAYTAHFAAQAKTKQLKKWVGQWKRLIQRKKLASSKGPAKNDQEDFLKRFGKGF